MEYRVLKENNSSLQQQGVSPKMNTEKQDDQHFTEFSKENITNPKSLTEIATESTSKLSAAITHDLNITKTSTPKYLKSRDKIMDEDSNESFAHIRPAYRQLNMNDTHKADISLSFLTDGLCKLGLDDSLKLNNYNQQPESNNLTLSDDEFVECQSFSNLSNYPRTQQSDVAPSFDSTAKTFDFTKSIVESNLNDVTVSCENVKPVVVEDSFRFAQQQQRQNESYSLDVSLNDRSMNINNTTRNVDDLKDLDRMLFKNLSYQDNVTSERSIEHGNKTVNDIESKFPLEFHHSITEQSLKSTQNDVLIGTNVNPNVTFEQETIQEDLTPATVDNVNMATIMIPTIQIQLVTPQKNSQNTSHEEVENVCSNSGIAEIGIRIKEEFEDAMDVDEQEDVEDNLYITPTKGLKFPFTRLNEVSFGHHSPSTEDIASNVSDTEEEFKMTEQNKSPYDEHDDINDENSNKDELADMFNNTFEKEKVPHDLTLNESPSTMTPVVVANKEKQMNFMDAIGNNFDVEFKVPSLPQSRKSGELCSNYSGMEDVFAGPKVSSDVKEEVFKPAASTFQFAETDFDFLQNREDSSKTWDDDPRNSILLKFDPLLRKPVPVFVEKLSNRLSNTTEEDDELIYIAGMNSNTTTIEETKQQYTTTRNSYNFNTIKEESMVDTNSLIIPLNNVDAMKDLINSTGGDNVNIDVNHYECADIKKTSNHNEQQQGHKIVEMENRIKNEVLKSEDSENKLKEAEMREEGLLKRITEKDKAINKMSGVVEAYEKAIAELIAEKEQLVLMSEKKCADLKHDGEMNAQHLASLETTFSDLHAKYERTKQLAAEQKEREEVILQEKKLNADNLKMQEMRYEKMKMHAMTQLEMANTKLSDLTRNHSAELTKLRAQLKKEEISRASTSEQLLQKTKENVELVKICDELINGQS